GQRSCWAVTGNPVPAPAPAGQDVYARLIAELDVSGARYRLIEHAPEGRTDLVSALRGHALASAAKCLILLVKVGKKQTRYVLAVVPGDARLDLAAVKALLGASYVAFADTGKAEQLAGSVTGTVLPFSYDERLELIADPVLLDHGELYFNAGRLDRSVALAREDYLRLARPRLARIIAS
ncbi:MAG: YbaK/EbsC family protein, partial [Streptosporangiaceae bacterium]